MGNTKTNGTSRARTNAAEEPNVVAATAVKQWAKSNGRGRLKGQSSVQTGDVFTFTGMTSVTGEGTFERAIAHTTEGVMVSLSDVLAVGKYAMPSVVGGSFDARLDSFVGQCPFQAKVKLREDYKAHTATGEEYDAHHITWQRV